MSYSGDDPQGALDSLSDLSLSVGDLVVVATGHASTNYVATIIGCRDDRGQSSPVPNPWWRLHLLVHKGHYSGQPRHLAVPFDNIKSILVISTPDEQS